MEIFPRAEIGQEVILKKLNIALSIFSPIAAAIFVPHPKPGCTADSGNIPFVCRIGPQGLLESLCKEILSWESF